MKINELSFPHPVLMQGGDDVAGNYVVQVEQTSDESSFTLSISHDLDNEDLKKMIAQKEAIFCAEVQCSETVIRKTFTAFSPQQKIVIPMSELRYSVDLDCYIIAAKKISYHNKAANADYGGIAFYVEKGDVLAFGGKHTFPVEKDWQAMRGALPFFTIRKGDFKEGPYEVNTNSTSGSIIIYLSEKDYAAYDRQHRMGFDAIFHSSIVLPALVHSLNQMFENTNDGELSDYKWIKALEMRRDSDEEIQRRWNADETLILAQMLLGSDPLARCLAMMERVENLDSDS